MHNVAPWEQIFYLPQRSELVPGSFAYKFVVIHPEL